MPFEWIYLQASDGLQTLGDEPGISAINFPVAKRRPG